MSRLLRYFPPVVLVAMFFIPFSSESSAMAKEKPLSDSVQALKSGRASIHVVQAPQDVTGKWEGEWASGGGRGAGQSGHLSIALRQEGDAVTGTIDSPDNNPPQMNLATGGTLKGNKLSLKTLSCPNGWLEASVSGNTMTGKISCVGTGSDFSATRSK